MTKTERVKSELKSSTKVPAPLHIKYRPTKFGDVLGQTQAVKSLSRMIRNKESQAYLLIGPSGVGKTTLARIAAVEWGCSEMGIVEIDAATRSGVDNVRDIQEMSRYQVFGEEGGRAIIIDECHGLSRQSWEALLKSIEEPPAHVVWFLCTTDPRKVPTTIKTRCATIQLRDVNEKALDDLLDFVCDEERIDIPDDVATIVVKSANGSPRQLLVNLATCRDAKNKREANELLQRAQSSDATIELCRFLMRPGSWTKAMAIVNRIEGDNHEGTRIIIVNYFGKVLKGATNDKQALHALSVIDNFATPYNQAEGIAPLLLSVGRTLFTN